MALEMKVYKDIHAYEAKAFAGVTFRQLGCIFFGGGLACACFFAIAWLYLINAGWQWQGAEALIKTDEHTATLYNTATNLAFFPAAAIFVPFAIYGWVRPKGLKPERFIPYWFDYQISPKELCYGHDAGHRPAGNVGTTAPARSQRRTKKDKKKVPSEH